MFKKYEKNLVFYLFLRDFDMNFNNSLRLFVFISLVLKLSTRKI